MDVSKHLQRVRVLANLLALFVVIAIDALVIFYLFHANPGSTRSGLYYYLILVIIVVGAIIGINLIGRILRIHIVPRTSQSVGSSLTFVFHVFAYSAMLAVIVFYLKVDVTGILVGAGFLGIVLGLAAQQVLGNFLGALSIMVARPFSTGERITMVTSSYGLMWPSYPHETLPAGYTGTVAEITLMYTRFNGDDGRPFSVPNGVTSQALIINHSRAPSRDLRVRIVLSRAIDYHDFTTKGIAAVGDVGGLRRDSVVARLTSVDEKTYEVLFQGAAVSGVDEQIRSEMLQKLLALSSQVVAAGATAPPPPPPAASGLAPGTPVGTTAATLK